MKYKVVRAIPGPGGEIVLAGEIVDPSGWRNLRSLIAAGKIVAIKDGEAPVVEDAKPAPAKKATKKVAPEPAAVEDESL